MHCFQRPHYDNTLRFIAEMEAITEQYKTMSAENGVFGILFPTYVKHDFQVRFKVVWRLDFYEFHF